MPSASSWVRSVQRWFEAFVRGLIAKKEEALEDKSACRISALAGTTTMRKGEVLALRWDRVPPGGCTVRNACPNEVRSSAARADPAVHRQDAEGAALARQPRVPVPFATDRAMPGTAAPLPLGLWEAVPRARQSDRHPARPHSRPAACRGDDPDDAWGSRPDRAEGHRTPLARARALPAPDAGAARVDREPDRDRAISREAGQEGTRKWHTYRHSARQACH